MMTIIIVEYAYQVSLKEKVKLAKKQSQWNIGKSPNRGGRIVKEKFHKPRGEAGKYHS
jgi:hypothetical protein